MANRYLNKAVRKDIYSNKHKDTFSSVVATYLNKLSQKPASSGVGFTGPMSIPEYQQFIPLKHSNCIVFGIDGNLTPQMVELVQINPDNTSQVITFQTFNVEQSDSDFYFRSITNEIYTFDNRPNGPLITIDSNGTTITPPNQLFRHQDEDENNNFYIVCADYYTVMIIHNWNWRDSNWAQGNYFWESSFGSTGASLFSINSFTFGLTGPTINEYNMFNYSWNCETGPLITIPPPTQYLISVPDKHNNRFMIQNNIYIDDNFVNGSQFLINDCTTKYHHISAFFTKTGNKWSETNFVNNDFNLQKDLNVRGKLKVLDKVEIKNDLEAYGAVRIKGCYNPLCLDGDAYFHKSLNVDSTISQGSYPLIPVGSSILGPTGSNYGIYTATADYITSNNSVNYFIYTKN